MDRRRPQRSPTGDPPYGFVSARTYSDSSTGPFTERVDRQTNSGQYTSLRVAASRSTPVRGDGYDTAAHDGPRRPTASRGGR